ncbi:helix-turn-helix domain-containing protein [Seohaeicola zhoushanensis]|uniref:AraC family transcriptional regulator n=1 Tax=Seohaeicola zhoushanensis TaxID=1569283 RepID=A0A8J3GWD8_9RHOB|nr:helix-turn-helix domain-containing protein [Seohaeicola zhoushanensis]GHF48424.1 AraC family transcriptional regulator [Seohaeicola zhoushanensis]
MAQSRMAAIPRYYLYGDQVSDVELNFIHVEPIRERSGAHDWTIRAHAHPDHHQILLVDRGGGEIVIEGQTYAIPTGSLVIVPAAMVHEIRFGPDTDGIVVTVATAYATSVSQGDKRLLEAVDHPGVYPIAGTGVSAEALGDAFEWLNREYIWSAPARRLAVMSHFLRILVAAVRLRGEHLRTVTSARDRDYDILMRYRELVERNFRREKAMDFYAGEIGVSAQRLNQACKARSGKTASEILHERAIIEAKRCLLYMEMTVAEIGYDLGFDDPAYFSRFFSQRVGQPPGAYRAQHTGEGASG